MTKKTTSLVAVDSLIFKGNCRTDACMNMAQMIDSLKRHGFKQNHPLVLSKKSDDSYLVLCGNRRGRGLIFLRDNDSEAYATALPGGKVSAMIHEGLSPEEETLIRIDHSSDEDREPLDQWSECKAIRQLMLIGHESQEQIAVKLGIFHTKGKSKGQPNRSYIQPRVNLARLPVFIQDEYRKLCDDPRNTVVRWTGISALYKAYNGEMIEYPDGNGPKLADAWAKALEPKPVAEVSGHNLTPKDARVKAQACTSSALKMVLLAATGQGESSLLACDSRLFELENFETVVGLLKEHLGGTYDEIVSEAIAAKVDQETEVPAA